MDLTALLLSQVQFFWSVGLFIFPLVLLYTVISYSVFRGKVRPTS